VSEAASSGRGPGTPGAPGRGRRRPGGTGWRSAAAVVGLCATLLAGCSTLRGVEREDVAPAEPSEPTVFNLSGRISFKQGKEAVFGGLRWHHANPEHQITLFSPVGTTIASLVGDTDGYTLTTSDQREFRSTDPDSLVLQVLGWRIPVNGMQHWVLGRAVPERPASFMRDQNQHLSHLEQDDWNIDYSDYRRFASVYLPGRIVMKRGDIEIRLFVDTWKLAAFSQ
jgi:outer membrane lipoprotein LolB